jgi:hypothetical protein
MAVVEVPPREAEPWPSLGGLVCAFLEERSVFGPGSFQGEPYRLSDEFRLHTWRAYELYPRWHPLAGRRRFKRVGVSVRKGLAKTEWAAQIAYAELHPEGPVRCAGWDAADNPAGRPVTRPYIPLMSVTVEQVEELAYGTLYYLCTEGPDADRFDVSDERVLRLSPQGREDGKAVSLSQSPGAREGARTTFQLFDEPHRLYLPRQVASHTTMDANLPKRPLEDPWALYVGTAGQPGQNSVAEIIHAEAEAIREGRIEEPRLYYFYRWAGRSYDLRKLPQRVDAIKEATGPTGEFGPGQYLDIAEQWDRPRADHAYLERVWLNRWRRSKDQAFDADRYASPVLRRGEAIPAGAFVAAGFDGARFRDSTAIVLTDIRTGQQQLEALWERPTDLPDDADWEVPSAEVEAAWEQIRDRYELWRCYGDPPYWTTEFGAWAGRWPDQFVEWWTNRLRQMAFAVQEYREGLRSAACTHTYRPAGELGWSEQQSSRDAALERHIAAASRKYVNIYDDQGQQLFILQKPRSESVV